MSDGAEYLRVGKFNTSLWTRKSPELASVGAGEIIRRLLDLVSSASLVSNGLESLIPCNLCLGPISLGDL